MQAEMLIGAEFAKGSGPGEPVINPKTGAQIVGNSRLFIGQAVYAHQGTAGNIPLAAAFTVVPIVIMGIYLWIAKRMGAFDAL